MEGQILSKESMQLNNFFSYSYSLNKPDRETYPAVAYENNTSSKTTFITIQDRNQNQSSVLKLTILTILKLATVKFYRTFLLKASKLNYAFIRK